MGHQDRDAASNRLIASYAHPDMAYWLACDLRREDLEELEALSEKEGVPGVDCLAESIETSDHCLFIMEAETRTILGFVGWGKWDQLDETFPNGYVWMIPSRTMMTDHFREITRAFRDYLLPELVERYGSVGNYIMNRNSVIRRWMSKAGFQDKETIEVDGHEFTMMLAAKEVV